MRKNIPSRIVRVLTVVAVLGIAGIPAVEAVTPLYPDLKTVIPKDLELSTEEIEGETHYVVRLTNEVWNDGAGPLELHGQPDGEISHATQRVYDSAGNYTDYPVGDFVYHPDHGHWHFENFAQYEVWSREDYTAWIRSGRVTGESTYAHSKVTFCIIDLHQRRGRTESRFNGCGNDEQGLSVGWGDIYGAGLVDQWVDVGEEPLADGNYVLRSIADPANLIKESANDDPRKESNKANEAITYFTIKNGQINNPGRDYYYY